MWLYIKSMREFLQLAIKHVRTEYVAFSDADDRLDEKFVEKILFYIQEYKPDIIYGGMERIPASECVIQSGGSVEEFVGKESIKEVKRALLNIEPRKLPYTILGTPCARAYKTEIVKTKLPI